MYFVLIFFLLNFGNLVARFSFYVTAEQFIFLPELGTLEGSLTKTAWTGKTIYQYLGVPYAESPSQKLRFKSPIPRSKWNGIRDAKKFGNPCPSVKRFEATIHNNNYGDGTGNGEQLANTDLEDCLHLSIYTKNIRGKNAVMVYIHGGSFMNGSSSEFHPYYLLEKDIVLVVPQYRLGIFGFLSTGTVDIPGNMGLLDIKLSLEWIQKYITYFGGDPKRITLFGQSAGGSIVSSLMISPIMQTKKLFQKIIIQSGVIIAGWSTITIDEAKHRSQMICMNIGCADCHNAELINKCLMNATVEKLIEINDPKLNPLLFLPVIGDYHKILPESPDILIQNGTNYPMIAGVTKHEGTFILSMAFDFWENMEEKDKKTIPPRKLIELLISMMKEKDSSGIIEAMATRLFFKTKYLNQNAYKKLIPGFIDFAGAIAIKSPLLHFTQLNIRNNPNPNYLYTFDYQGEYTCFGYGSNTDHYPFKGGVHHSDENIYLFATHDLHEDDDVKMAKIMIDYWTSFAINGVPESKNAQKWESFKTSNGPYQHLDVKPSKGTDFSDEFLVAINDPLRSIIRSYWF